jgi:hypothetical protein
VVHSPARSQLSFQSISGPLPYIVWGWRFSVGPALSLFLSGLLVVHRSGQSPKTIVLYSMANLPNTVRGKFTPRESQVKTE